MPTSRPARCAAALCALALSTLPAPGGGAFTPLPTVAAHLGAALSQDSGNGYVTLRVRNHELVFVPDVRRVTFNGLALHLNAPYIVVDGTGLVSGADVETVLAPLLDPAAGHAAIHARPVIVLDPGHGGEDSGALAAAPGVAEKDIVLQLAKRLRAHLAQAGLDVRLTREDDTYIPLDQRADLANRWGADLFVSIHLNSSRNKDARGVETFVIPAAGFPSTAEGSKVAGAYPGNAHNAENTRLAYYVHKGLVARTDATDRGVRRARYEVLRATRCPAVLTECGFLTNPDEAWLLRKDDYCDKITKGLASGILTYVSRRTAATRPVPVWTEPTAAELAAAEAPPALAPSAASAHDSAAAVPPEPAGREPEARDAQQAAVRAAVSEEPEVPEHDIGDESKPPIPTLPPSALVGESGTGVKTSPAPESNPLAPSTVTPIE